MRSLIHVDRYFEYRDEENPHTKVSRVSFLQKKMALMTTLRVLGQTSKMQVQQISNMKRSIAICHWMTTIIGLAREQKMVICFPRWVFFTLVRYLLKYMYVFFWSKDGTDIALIISSWHIVFEVLLQNVLPRNVIHYKTSLLQNVLPHNVLPQNVLPQNGHPYKTSSYTKRPPIQNVLPQNVHSYKTSFTIKCPSLKKNYIYIYKKILNQ
jgi:hypothetical protein